MMQGGSSGGQNRIHSNMPVLAVGAGAALGMLLLKRLSKKPEKVVLRGKVVVITGGSRGLGLALAEEFSRAGAKLVLAARDPEELKRAEQMLRERNVLGHEPPELVAGDLREEAACQKLIARATERFGQVDILINNAGVIHVGPIEKQPLAAFRDAMATDFFAAVQLTSVVMPQMLERRAGSIVNIASIGGKIPVPHLAPYNAAKFATVGYSATLHAEMKSKGIRVTTVCPGLLRTGSYPNAIVVGDLEKEYRWFSLSASVPGLAHAVPAAAKKILTATVDGRAEITIGVDAYLAARFYGLMPETATALGSLAEQVLLPKTAGTETLTPAKRIRAPRSSLWQALSRRLTLTQNQPSA